MNFRSILFGRGQHCFDVVILGSSTLPFPLARIRLEAGSTCYTKKVTRQISKVDKLDMPSLIAEGEGVGAYKDDSKNRGSLL